MRFALGFALLFAAGTTLGAEPKAKPNVVVIVADELGPRDMGCTGSTYYKTPNLDAFAKAGVKLEEAYLGSSSGAFPAKVGPEHKLLPAGAAPDPPDTVVPDGYGEVFLANWSEAELRKQWKATGGKPVTGFIYLTALITADQIAKYKAGRPGTQGHPAHAAAVEELDRQFGAALKVIEDLGGADNSVIVFTAKRGGNSVEWSKNRPTTSNAPFREGAGYLYEGGLRVPFLICGPGIKTGGFPFPGDDLLPTLAGFCGAPPNPRANGYDRSRQFRGEAEAGPGRALHWHFPNYSQTFAKPGGAIRIGNYKLIEYFEDGRRELFDLAKDIGESRNLAAEKPDFVKELAAKLAAWRKEVGAKMPTPNPDYKPNPQSEDGSITLHARTASVTGTQLRFEPAPHKNTLGYWTNAADTASFEFTVTKPGTFAVSVLQGAGKGSGGAEVELAVGESKAKFTVKDTGGFQAFELREVGELTIDKAGIHKLTVTPKLKPGVAVMDLREVVLSPKR